MECGHDHDMSHSYTGMMGHSIRDMYNGRLRTEEAKAYDNALEVVLCLVGNVFVL